MFSYFSPSCYTDYSNSKTGFYKVYGDVFDKVYANEVNYCRKMGLNSGLVKEAPLMGDLGSDYYQVNAFYGYWLSFCTVMDFGWVDKWDAAAGVNRKSRRVMEEENKKLRKKAKKEYNETVRGLAEFAKKRDKRVIDMMVRKEKEREKKREEEMAKRKEKERERLQRARMYEEPEWAKVEEVEEFEGFEEDEEGKEEEKKELYCVACGKKFKSEKQWKNHEKSKKHKEKVAELRKSFVEEEGLEEVADEDGGKAEIVAETEEDRDNGNENDVGRDGYVSAEDDIEELEKRFEDSVGLEKGKSKDVLDSDDEDEIGDAEELVGLDKSVGSEDEMSILEAMLSGRKNKKNVTLKTQRNPAKSEDEVEPMEYNNKKGKRKSRRAKKDKCKNFEAEASKADDGDTNVQGEEDNRTGGLDIANGGGNDDQANHGTQSSTRNGEQSVGREGTSKRDDETKPKKSSKGRKQKEKSKYSNHECEKCGEEFDSRNKLHKHLSDTGHALLKFR